MKFVAGSDRDVLGLALCEAIGVDPSAVRRIVIDLETGSAAKVYWETYADDEKLKVAFEGGLQLVGAEEEARA